MRDNGDPFESLKPQPGQGAVYRKEFHPLPGVWAKEQLSGRSAFGGFPEQSRKASRSSVHLSGIENEIHRALASEKAQHHYWEEWQGVIPGEPVYEDPREMQNTLLPTARFGTEGRGYG